MHFWLHSCGNNTSYLPDLIDAGVDVFLPVQKHTMDEAAVAAEFGDRLTFLAGFDVQHALVEGSPEQVRDEVRFLVNTFNREDGGMCIAAGNGIVGGTPFENIEAFLDEAVLSGSSADHCHPGPLGPERSVVGKVDTQFSAGILLCSYQADTATRPCFRSFCTKGEDYHATSTCVPAFVPRDYGNLVWTETLRWTRSAF